MERKHLICFVQLENEKERQLLYQFREISFDKPVAVIDEQAIGMSSVNVEAKRKAQCFGFF